VIALVHFEELAREPTVNASTRMLVEYRSNLEAASFDSHQKRQFAPHRGRRIRTDCERLREMYLPPPNFYNQVRSIAAEFAVKTHLAQSDWLLF